MINGGIILTEEWRGAEELGEKPVPLPFCPPQISHRQPRDRNRPYAFRGRSPNAWAAHRARYTNNKDILWAN